MKSDTFRKHNVSLTSAGVQAFNRIYPTAQKHEQAALQGFSRKEVDMLRDFLRRIQDNIEAEE